MASIAGTAAQGKDLQQARLRPSATPMVSELVAWALTMCRTLLGMLLQLSSAAGKVLLASHLVITGI